MATATAGAISHYVAGSYYSHKDQLFYVFDVNYEKKTVELEECLSRFNDPARPVERRSHTLAWCEKNLTFQRAPRMLGELWDEADVASSKEWGGAG